MENKTRRFSFLHSVKKKIIRVVRRYQLAKSGLQVEDNLEREALLLCHALEKGMAMPIPRKGFGIDKANKLLLITEKLISQNRSSLYSVQESLAVLYAYCEFHKEDKTITASITEKVIKLYNTYHEELSGGYSQINKESLEKGIKIDFEMFIHSRHSMRFFSDETISNDEIINAISLAKMAPSACNRQPWKFYYTFSNEINCAIRKCLPQQQMLPDIPFFGIITVDKTLFTESEVNQWYINGGIFLGFLELSFHHLGIGSCIIQLPPFIKTGPVLRKLMHIPDNEVLISAIGYGKYPQIAKCLLAARRNNGEIAIQVE